MKNLINLIKELRNFLLLWSTQSLSTLGSSMTNFALVIWTYQEKGSALTTALLSICSYAPYVIMSIFAGALSDKWNKKVTMLVSDTFAAVCTVIVLVLLQTGNLEIWHLYCLNGLNGLMNTIQQPASDVSISILTPKEHYQKVGGLRSFSYSLVNFLTPVLATAILALGSLKAVIFFDLATFVVAFCTLLFAIKIPDIQTEESKKETVLEAAKNGLRYLKKNRGVFDIILFLSAINFVASIFDAALPALLLPRANGGEKALGLVNAVSGVAMLVGSVIASIMPAPKNRGRVICNTLLIAMGTENFILAFGNTIPVWCLGAVLGWITIPIMNANLDVILRSNIAMEMQGRVFSVRNTLQFFTIPLGFLLGGVLVDYAFEPFMAKVQSGSFWTACFGTGKGSGAAMLFMFLGFAGVLVCLIFRRDKHIWKLEDKTTTEIK